MKHKKTESELIWESYTGAPDESPTAEPSVEDMIDFYKNDPGGQRAWGRGGVEYEFKEMAKGKTLEGISDRYVGWTPEMFEQVFNAVTSTDEKPEPVKDKPSVSPSKKTGSVKPIVPGEDLSDWDY